jgi:hypothetical protein
MGKLLPLLAVVACGPAFVVPRVAGTHDRLAFVILDQPIVDPPAGAEAVNARLAEATGALADCYEDRLAGGPDIAGVLTYAFAVAADGATGEVKVTFADPEVTTCASRVLGELRFTPVEAALHAHGTVRLAPRPHRCAQLWKVGHGARACRRDQAIELLVPGDPEAKLVLRVPAAPVADLTPDGLVLEGPCRADDDNAANAVCVIEHGSASVVYLFPETASSAGFTRGIVRPAPGSVWATNGLQIAESSDTNKTTTQPGDVQAELVRDGVKTDAACADWHVATPLHRTEQGFQITFAEGCGSTKVHDVALEFSPEGHRWRALATRSL